MIIIIAMAVLVLLMALRFNCHPCGKQRGHWNDGSCSEEVAVAVGERPIVLISAAPFWRVYG